MRHQERQSPERGHVGRQEDVQDAGPPPRLTGVDPRDARVGVGAPLDRDVQHPRQRDVGDVPAAARDQPPVLAAANPGAEQALSHRRPGL
jgi:hypothetical protein